MNWVLFSHIGSSGILLGMMVEFSYFQFHDKQELRVITDLGRYHSWFIKNRSDPTAYHGLFGISEKYTSSFSFGFLSFWYM